MSRATMTRAIVKVLSVRNEFGEKSEGKKRSDQKKDRKEYCDFNDLMLEATEESIEVVRDSDSAAASEEWKFLPDKWVLTKHAVIRIHNTPRKTLFAPNENPLDPYPIPSRFLDVMRRTDTSCSSKLKATATTAGHVDRMRKGNCQID